MIVKRFKWTMLVPLAILVAAVVVGIFTGGLNLGIDFTGGSLITIELHETFDSEEVRVLVEQTEGVSGEVTVVTSDETQALIRLQSKSEGSEKDTLVSAILTQVQTRWPNATLAGIDSVGGIASGELVLNALLAVVIACVLMLVYIWIRFELFSGIGAVAALVHDVLIMICVMCIFRVSINSTFIAACLTIVGYSINATVILFDRIRDNLKLLSKDMTREQITDCSVKQTLDRTINTSITTLIMIVSLYIFGVQSVREFALPIIVGIFAGIYSSLLIAPAVWMKLAAKFGRKKRSGIKTIR